MQKTVKLYENDVTCVEFCAQVLACTEKDGQFAVVVTQTAFYPEGGGQPADHGALGGARVIDVHEKGGIITHITTTPLRVGEQVQGNVDTVRRYDMMQQHTGEHLISGLVHSAFGYENVGFHLNDTVTTVDFSGPLAAGDIARLEEAANWCILKNQPVTTTVPTAEKLEKLEYRSKKELTGDVRIVTVGDVDVCACCGTHVQSTGEIQLVKILSAQSYKGGTRITLVCGQRALHDYMQKCESNHAISVLLSAKPEETAAAVQRLLAENAALKNQAALLEAQLCEQLAQSYKGTENPLVFTQFTAADSLRRLCDALAKSCRGTCAVFGKNENGTRKYAVCTVDGDARTTAKAMNAALNGRGGGKADMAQGSVEAAEMEIRAFFTK